MIEFVREHLLVESSLISVAYLFTLSAYLVRDVLPLRVLLIAAALTMLGFALHSGNEAIAFWNTLFVAVNAVHVVLLVRERRPVSMDPEQRRVYEQIFWIMRPRAFLRLWGRGRELRLEEGCLCTEGAVPDDLYLVLEGEISIERDGRQVARVGPLDMVGEMSFINGTAASADAVIRTPVRVRGWRRGDLQRLKRSDPGLFSQLNVIVGQDLVRKLTGSGAARGEVTNSFESWREDDRQPAAAGH